MDNERRKEMSICMDCGKYYYGSCDCKDDNYLMNKYNSFSSYEENIEYYPRSDGRRFIEDPHYHIYYWTLV